MKEVIANMESFSFVANFEVYVVNETGKKVKKRRDNGIVYKVGGHFGGLYLSPYLLLNSFVEQVK